MFRRLAALLLVLISCPIAMARNPAMACKKETDAAVNSVARILVDDSSGNESRGTGFIVQTTQGGKSGKSTIYLLTAAHVFLGERTDKLNRRSAQEVFDEIKSIEIQFGASKAEQFAISEAFVFFPDSLSTAAHWFDKIGEDIAIIKITGVEKSFASLPLRMDWKAPEPPTFLAYGVRAKAEGPLATPAFGEVAGAPGEDRPEQWLRSDASFEPGMSGGPAIFCEGKKAVVYALIQGRADKAGDLKYLVPFYISEAFIRSRIPGFSKAHSVSSITTKEWLGAIGEFTK